MILRDGKRSFQLTKFSNLVLETIPKDIGGLSSIDLFVPMFEDLIELGLRRFSKASIRIRVA